VDSTTKDTRMEISTLVWEKKSEKKNEHIML